MADVDILLVEDNPGDTHLVEQTFEERALPGRLHTVQTGARSIEWLQRRDEYEDAPRPDLVILDLNLPVTSGHEVLDTIKSDPELRHIPVIVLTGSQSDTDLVKAYDSHANACLVKPVDPEEFGDLFERVTEFWVATARLPTSPP
jgi:CheY-like chemotaxis protein